MTVGLSMYFVYFLKSERNGKIYVGSTGQELEKRLKQHNVGANVWTKLNKLFKLIYYEKYWCKKDAEMREKFYKIGFGREIKKLIVQNIGV